VSRIVGILLAAGRGRRFGRHKLLAPLPNGEPVGIQAARRLIAGLPEALAVVRVDDPPLARAVAALGLRVLAHPGADEGLGSSLAAGIAAAPRADGWLIALADMPWVRPGTHAAVAAALRAGATLAAPTYQGRRGHPVGFARLWQAELLALTGDRGARHLLEAAGSELSLVPTDDPGVLLDIDRPADVDSGPA